MSICPPYSYCSLFPVSCFLFPVPCSLFPKTQKFVPHLIEKCYTIT
ncbi:MAG: hypothetical protein F6K56_40650 [Moorea sp. SIO3G5]|nr:hypothetical protein [Moorena sp. SIO3G5]